MGKRLRKLPRERCVLEREATRDRINKQVGLRPGKRGARERLLLATDKGPNYAGTSVERANLECTRAGSGSWPFSRLDVRSRAIAPIHVSWVLRGQIASCSLICLKLRSFFGILKTC